MSHESPHVLATGFAEPHEKARAPAQPLRSYGLGVRSAAEGAGSFLVVLAGIGVTTLNTDAGIPPVLAFGFGLLAAFIAFGHVSGGHFIPAITLGSAVAGRTPWRSVVPYIVAQVLGAVAATGFLWLILSANSQLPDSTTLFSVGANGFGEHSAVQFPLTSSFLAEVVATALLVAVFLGATARLANRAVAPFAVGLAYAALLTVLLPITNGSMNPARSTAAAIFSEGWALEQLWLFWAAPVVGAVLAGLIYRGADLPSKEIAAPSGAASPASATVTAAESSTDSSPASASASPSAEPKTDSRSFFDQENDDAIHAAPADRDGGEPTPGNPGR
ncbi:aquaporin [Arthrobacter sp. Br18]|uniref:aquaporin n=1 Tax=Arthrobacter sp. Br18 TaxID=1312954 RepID=UPI0004BC99A4|nr:aquaporin [Arthrobacter sp. Br18]